MEAELIEISEYQLTEAIRTALNEVFGYGRGKQVIYMNNMCEVISADEHEFLYNYSKNNAVKLAEIMPFSHDYSAAEDYYDSLINYQDQDLENDIDYYLQQIYDRAELNENEEFDNIVIY